MTRRHSKFRLAIVAFALVAISPALFARNLTTDERVAYQRAIEEVYWNHRAWPTANPAPKPPLSSVMPDTALRARVEDYLKKSNALETYWQRPVTALQLQAEMNRMARDTRDGATLSELFHALGDDSYVIAETLARQTLVDRLIHNWYADDTRFHGDLKARAEAALASCASVDCMKFMNGFHQQTGWKLRTEGTIAETEGSRDGTITLDAAEWSDELRKLATEFNATAESLPTNRLSGVEETPDRFFVTAILAQRDNEITTASVVWPKRSFDSWWKTEATSVGAAIAPSSGVLAIPTIPSTTCTNDTWAATTHDWPEPRDWHTAVWTGTEMIVWGGHNYDGWSHSYRATGGRYNPATDTWTATATGANIPEARENHTAVWTGTEMIVWGGYNGAASGYYVNTGGRYNPTTDAWITTSTGANTPQARTFHSAVWTGTEMIVWGGYPQGAGYLNTGGRYDPSTDTWAPTSTGANVPSARAIHAAVWTGREMIVWGGGGDGFFNPPLNTGGRYDPATDTWTATSTGAGVPTNRANPTAVWTGTQMIVWGGSGLNTGGRYDPSTDTWTGTSTGANVPVGRGWHTAVWTGTEMLVWGGNNGSGSSHYLNSGGRYSPATDTWVATSTGANVPDGREYHTAVWTGTEMIVWGGVGGYAMDLGGRYNPSTDTWAASATGAGKPSARYWHTAVWTGTEMIVWGGRDPYNAFVNTGGRYNPATDTWKPTATGANAPLGRSFHSAVWTGTEMIVWGGRSVGLGGPTLNTGGRYDPSIDVWTATSTGANAPLARFFHSAVWTGTEMIVWGGSNGTTASNSGGRYDPVSDAWTATSTGANVPPASSAHTAVWTGTEMIVWGGGNNTGGRYHPATDTWTATSTGANAPSARSFHTAVWTGSEMIVWGGVNGNEVNTGGRYDPSSDTWRTTSTGTNVPGARTHHTAAWTGTEMIVWGGNAYLNYFGTGGRYNPSTDMWTATSTGSNVPAQRSSHTAVWTGKQMIAWGGQNNSSTLTTGGLYCACPNGTLGYRDVDGDGYGDPTVSVATCDGALPAGYVANGGDCNDASTVVHPGAAESCDGLDDDCDGSVDNGGGSTLCADGNVCTDDVCNGMSGCIHANNTLPCSDGNACTSADTCGGGTCNSGAPLLCDDNNVCTTDTCDPGTGCLYADNTAACDDGNACTSGDFCSGGVCHAGGGVPPPAEVEAILVSIGDETTLTWTAASGDDVYDVVSSTISDLQSRGTAAAICLSNDIHGTSFVDPQTELTSGHGYYYLIRAQNTCGTGSYGSDSTGQERLPTSACP